MSLRDLLTIVQIVCNVGTIACLVVVLRLNADTRRKLAEVRCAREAAKNPKKAVDHKMPKVRLWHYREEA